MTDEEAKLTRKGHGKEGRLSYGAHALMETRNGFIVVLHVAGVLDETEREAAVRMLDRSAAGRRRITVAGDKGFNNRGFVQQCRERNITPHVARNINRKAGSAIDGRTTHHEGYRVSQRIRKRVEEIFGWMKTIGGFRRTRYKGRDRTHWRPGSWARLTT